GGWIRTNAWQDQNLLPYRLATPLYLMQRVRCTVALTIPVADNMSCCRGMRGTLTTIFDHENPSFKKISKKQQVSQAPAAV
ncbi:MAG: hypothetical protein ACN6PK_17680, partial [Pseudomonas shirazensis]